MIFRTKNFIKYIVLLLSLQFFSSAVFSMDGMEVRTEKDPFNLSILVTEEFIEKMLPQHLKVMKGSERISSTIKTHTGLLRSVVASKVSGDAQVEGRTKVNILPSTNHAMFQIEYDGSIHSKTLAHSGVDIFVHGGSKGRVSAKKKLSVGQDFEFQMNDTEVNVNLEPFITGVSANSEIKERIAFRRATRNETISEVKGQILVELKKRFKMGFDRHLSEKKFDVNLFIPKPVSDFALASFGSGNDIKLNLMRAYSEENFACLSFHLGSASQRQSISPNQAIRFYPEPHDLQVQVHESGLNILMAKILSGKRINDREFKDFGKLLYDEVPLELDVHKRKKHWNVTFDDMTPLRIQLLPMNEIELNLKIKDAEIGGERLSGSLLVSVRYLIDYDPFRKSFRFFRVSEPLVSVIREGDISEPMNEMEMILEKKFDSLFLPEITLGGLSIPDHESLSLFTRSKVSNYNTDSGWFMMAIDME